MVPSSDVAQACCPTAASHMSHGASAAAGPSTGSGTPKASAAGGNGKTRARDAWYSFNEEKLEEVMSSKAWMTDPKFFKKVRISPSAAMKMLMHASSGVERGMKRGGNPVEVMGFLLGRLDTEVPTTMVITDVFALPVEGTETRVVANDESVQNYMINLSESLELTRKERFMGWYHSHPFDVEVHSHCFLSTTDVQTQLAWQIAFDKQDPWLAIVVDPLRSLVKNVPQFGAFRVYPPNFNAPADETPDGKIVTDDKARVERWAASWNRYYVLEIEYFMSSLADNVMSHLTENFLWMRTLATTPQLDRENAERFSERIVGVAEKLEQVAALEHGHAGAASAGGHFGGYVMGDTQTKDESGLAKATQSSCEMALEQCQGQLSQIAKHVVMN